MKAIWIILIVLLFLAAGFGGWFFFLKKSPEGGKCAGNNQCESGLKCVNHLCSSGKEGSVCQGTVNCQTNLLCLKNLCSQKPDYSQYFSKVVISKMKPGLAPGPNNPLTQTTTFAKTDAIEVDFVGVKSSTSGPYYLEFVNSSTGKMESTTDKMDTQLQGQDRGSGTDLSNLDSGQYDLLIYLNNQVIFATQITVS